MVNDAALRLAFGLRSTRMMPFRQVGRAMLRAVGRIRQPIQSQCGLWTEAPQAYVDDLDCPYVTEPNHPFTWIRVRGTGGRMVVPGHGRQYYRKPADECIMRTSSFFPKTVAPADSVA
jgi:hypothetical protein